MQYDAAIIGAGPAGATFARRLAQQSPELKILLLDAQDEGHKKPCGGLLAPDAQKTLAHFDLVLPKSVLADPQIFAVETMDLRTRRVRYYQRYYLNMDRYAFDRWLVSLARFARAADGRDRAGALHGRVENGRGLRPHRADGGGRSVVHLLLPHRRGRRAVHRARDLFRPAHLPIYVAAAVVPRDGQGFPFLFLHL